LATNVVLKKVSVWDSIFLSCCVVANLKKESVQGAQAVLLPTYLFLSLKEFI
jgi:hypothetical protein